MHHISMLPGLSLMAHSTGPLQAPLSSLQPLPSVPSIHKRIVPCSCCRCNCLGLFPSAHLEQQVPVGEPRAVAQADQLQQLGELHNCRGRAPVNKGVWREGTLSD